MLLVGTACKQTPERPIEWRSAVLSVRVDPRKPNGKHWDIEGTDAPPDPAVCILHPAVRGKSCFPGNAARVTTAACSNRYFCEIAGVRVPASEAFEVEVWDVDISAHDHVCTVRCSFGQSCTAEGCSVAVHGATSSSDVVDSGADADADVVDGGALADAGLVARHHPNHNICPFAARRAIKRMQQCGFNTEGFTEEMLCQRFEYNDLSFLGSRSCPEMEMLLNQKR